MNQMPQETASPLNPGNQEMSHQPKPGMSGAFKRSPAKPINRNVVANFPG